MKKVIIFIAMFFPLILSARQDSVTFKHRAGINAGFTTGLGFAYGYWPGKLGVQISFLPIKAENLNFFSVAITPCYTLRNRKYFKFFWFLGNHIISDNNTTEYNIGTGPGFETGKRVVFSLRGGFGFFDVTNSFNILPTN